MKVVVAGALFILPLQMSKVFNVHYLEYIQIIFEMHFTWSFIWNNAKPCLIWDEYLANDLFAKFLTHLT